MRKLLAAALIAMALLGCGEPAATYCHIHNPGDSVETCH